MTAIDAFMRIQSVGTATRCQGVGERDYLPASNMAGVEKSWPRATSRFAPRPTTVATRAMPFNLPDARD
jgi:hypothetical protein